jgi:hypothetical protein
MNRTRKALIWLGAAIGLTGCHHPSITAVSLSSQPCIHPHCFPFNLYHHCKEPEGIPFYLPKPLLIVAKNFRNVEDAKVGVTSPVPIPNEFEPTAGFGTLNAQAPFLGGGTPTPPEAAAGGKGGSGAGMEANTGTPTTAVAKSTTTQTAPYYSESGPPLSPAYAGVTSERLTPEAFYTYHIVFVPDMTQKYGLKVRGGVGEFRAAMNLVNGWQFTGLGPFYMKDSSTAQNTLATGIAANLTARGVGDVIRSLVSAQTAGAQATGTKGGGGGAGFGPGDTPPANAIRAIENLQSLNLQPVCLPNYAEIHIYEAYLTPDGMMDWRPIAEHTFGRDILGVVNDRMMPGVIAMPQAPPSTQAPQAPQAPPAQGGSGSGFGAGTPEPSVPNMEMPQAFDPTTMNDLIRRELNLPVGGGTAGVPGGSGFAVPAGAGFVGVPIVAPMTAVPGGAGFSVPAGVASIPGAVPAGVAGLRRGPLHAFFGKHHSRPRFESREVVNAAVQSRVDADPSTVPRSGTNANSSGDLIRERTGDQDPGGSNRRN